jgi:hypothetical protein
MWINHSKLEKIPKLIKNSYYVIITEMETHSGKDTYATHYIYREREKESIRASNNFNSQLSTQSNISPRLPTTQAIDVRPLLSSIVYLIKIEHSPQTIHIIASKLIIFFVVSSASASTCVFSSTIDCNKSIHSLSLHMPFFLLLFPLCLFFLFLCLCI